MARDDLEEKTRCQHVGQAKTQVHTGNFSHACVSVTRAARALVASDARGSREPKLR